MPDATPARPRSLAGWLFILSALALAISGMAQMPIFKRYYIADLPGLAWTADFAFTHRLHYLAAIPFLAILAWRGTQWLTRGASRLSPMSMLRVAALVGLVLTGFLRVWKNLPGADYASLPMGMAVDIGHLALAMLWGGLALIHWRMTRRRVAVRP